MRVKHDDNFIYLHDVSKSEDSVMSLHHAAVYSKPKKRWRLPLNHYVMTELYNAHPELRENEEFLELGMRVKADFNKRVALRKDSLLLKNDPANVLRPYQYQDLRYLLTLDAAGIFNEPRTGKTPVAIELMRHLGMNRNLVVCPASIVGNWEAELAKWWPEAKAIVYAGSKRGNRLHGEYLESIKKGEACVLIMSKDTLKLDLSKLDEYYFDTMFVDEAHFLRNYNSGQSEAVFTVSKNAHRRYAMTGTPTVEHPADVWGILHFLYPSVYTSYWQFCPRYFQVNKAQYGPGNELGWPRKDREKELKEIVGLMSVQRKRKEVMSWLPDKTFKKIECEMSSKQMKLYDDMKSFFASLDEDDGTEIDAENVITQFMRMRQLCLDPRLLGFDVKGAKTTALLDFIDNHKEPIVVMSMFSSYLELIKPEIEKLGRKVGVIDGSVSSTKKMAVVQAFQAGKLDLLLCNIISAGTGFTLDRSNCVLFTDRAWTPVDNSQAEDRICPTSEERNHAHVIYDLECKKSIDRRVNNILRRKSSLIQYINEGGREAVKQLLMEG
jgi:SNF2 family DNA or RNA helicase